MTDKIERKPVYEIETKLGTLRVDTSAEPDEFPGVYVSLVRPGGNTFTTALIEVDQSWNGKPFLAARCWTTEDYWGDPSL